ncbi:TonB-dependent receptor [Maricurvus nonylphenolicus]|uniref:TonB-dependent receptor n=1 Tax=Maricurvus nonylphenolicus TaxID=1008307 RepID=UPI0036F23D93
MLNSVASKTALLGALGLMTSTVGFAQPMLEEIVVTAQKRAEGLTDVPISIAAVTGDSLEDQGIFDMSGLVDSIPSVSLQTSPNFSVVNVRGVTTGGANLGFEQSVGMYIDGLYVSRGKQANSPFLDLERVEVLRGPQGVLQGKNSVAGAVVISTRRPTDEFEAVIRGNYEFENDGQGVEAIVSGPITDSFKARLVASTNKVGGWLDTLPRQSSDGSTALKGRKDQNESEIDTIRLSAVWDVNDDFSVFAKYEHAEKKVTGTSYGTTGIQPGATVAGTPFLIIDDFTTRQPGFDTIDNGVAASARHVEVNADGTGVVVSNKEDERTVDSDAFTLQLDWDLPIGMVTSISTYSEFESHSNFSFPPAPFEFFTQDEEENFEQFTQELRLVSPGGETFDYVVGLYFVDQEIKVPNVQQIGAPSLTGGGLVPTTWDYQTNREFQQSVEAYAAFGQVTWNVSDVFRVNAGLRYSYENKSLDDHSVQLGFFDTSNPAENAFAAGLFGVSSFTYDELEDTKIHEEGVDPSLSMQWDMTPDTAVYLSYTKATKAGGFNAVATNVSNISFDSEEAEGYELGLKTYFFDRRMQLNVALFTTEYTDQQVSVLDSTTNSLVVNNAGAATSEGLEADVRFAATSNLELGGALSFVDATYDDFVGAPCSPGLSLEADCDMATNSRNAKGDKLPNAPEWSGSAYFIYSYPLDGMGTIRVRGDVFYSDEFFVAIQNDDYAAQDSFTKADLSIGYDSADDNWSVNLVGRNITDKRTTSFGGGVTLRDGAYWGIADAPRTITLNADYRF